MYKIVFFFAVGFTLY